MDDRMGAVLVQAGKIHDFPIILMGTDYWQPLLSFLKDTMLARGCIDAKDFEALGEFFGRQQGLCGTDVLREQGKCVRDSE